ncbi:hypothetical protein [Algoriphagus namhaensis]
MNQSFFHIAQIRFDHEYFGENNSFPFQMGISEGHSRRLKNLNLYFKPTVSGCEVFSSNTDLIQDEEGSIELDFYINDPLFYNYTDLDKTYHPPHLLYANNFSFESSVYALKDPGMVSSASLVAVQTASLEHVFSALGDHFEIQDQSGQVLLSVAGSPLVAGQLPDGFYLAAKGEETLAFYYRGGGTFHIPDMVISLSPKQLWQDANGGFAQYSLSLPVRKTTWRYILSDPIYSRYGDLGILDMKSKNVNFSKEDFTLSAGNTFTCFRSDRPIPLSANKAVDFQLVDQYKPELNSKTIVIKSLPQASAQMLYPDVGDSSSIYSHIFI